MSRDFIAMLICFGFSPQSIIFQLVSLKRQTIYLLKPTFTYFSSMAAFHFCTYLFYSLQKHYT